MRDGPVLIVDDDRDVRESLCDLLADEGFRTAEAADGSDALVYLRTHAAQCPLVLLDWNMPVMDAAALGHALKAEQIAAPPTILLTADSRVLAAVAGSDYVASLKKPVNIEVLMNLVRRYCARPGSGAGEP